MHLGMAIICMVILLKEHKYDRDGNPMFPDSDFHYSGNFVTINLRELREKFLNAKYMANYFGVKLFWSTLYEIKKAYCVHQSDVLHYVDVYPESNYK